MNAGSNLGMRFVAFAKAAWKYVGIATTVGTWGYRTPSPDEINDTTRQLRELLAPRPAVQRVRPANVCCAAEVVPCCA